MLLSILIGVLAAATIGNAYVAIKTRRLVNEAYESIQDFFIPKSESEPSDFVKLIGQIGGTIAGQVTEGVNSSIASALGGTMKGATNELELRTKAEDPLAAIMGGMPKAIQKNPWAYAAMQALISKNLPTGGGSISGGNGGESYQTRFNF